MIVLELRHVALSGLVNTLRGTKRHLFFGLDSIRMLSKPCVNG